MRTIEFNNDALIDIQTSPYVYSFIVHCHSRSTSSQDGRSNWGRCGTFILVLSPKYLTNTVSLRSMLCITIW